MSNLHLINDEKITLEMVSSFQNYSINDIFIIFKKSSSINNDYSKYNNIYYSDNLNINFEDITFNKLFIHFLDINKVNFIESNKINYVKIIWLLWGGDLYNRPEFGNSIVDSETLKIQLSTNYLKETIRLLTNPFRGNYLSMGKIKKFAKKIDYIATTIEEDQLLANKIFNINTKFLPFNFYHIESQIENCTKKQQNNIIIGNSATFTNNHIPIIRLLSKIDLEGRKVYVPLSYGNKKYAEKVKKIGEQLLGDHFIPLMDFMTFDQYNQILDNCEIAIYNFYRQQGFGNITTLLSKGKKVYLNDKNTMYDYFLDKNISVGNIKNFTLNNANLNVELNKIHISDCFSYKRFNENLKQLINAE